MELTSKQRAQLRGLANSIDTILQVGKDGIGENLIKQANDALEARELIKGKVLENSLLSAREGAEELAQAGRAHVNLVVSSSGLAAAKALKKLFGTPYVIGVPMGEAYTALIRKALTTAVWKPYIATYMTFSNMAKPTAADTP